MVADEDGKMVVGVSGPVWAGLPQSAPCAETVAAVATAQLLNEGEGEAKLVGDNRAVIDFVNDPPLVQALDRFQHAGLWRTAMTEEGWSRMRGGARHIHSHQLDEHPDLLLDPCLDATTKHHLLGNQLADSVAGDAQDQHHQWKREEWLVDCKAHSVARAVVELAAKLLPLHPRRAKHPRPPQPPRQRGEAVGEGTQASQASEIPFSPFYSFSELPPTPPTPAPPLPIEHRWEEINGTLGTWRCLTCGLVSNTGHMESPQAATCPGASRVISRVGVGHRLVRYRPTARAASTMAECFSCTLCCRTGTSQQVFVGVCDERPTKARRMFFNRVEKGLHPHPRWGNRTQFAAGVLVGFGGLFP